MQKKVEKVAVVEIGGSHDECLASQFIALKGHGCQVTFVGTEDVWKRNPSFETYVDHFHAVQFKNSSYQNFRLMLELNRYFKREKISKVILNTAQGGHIRNLTLTAPQSIEFIGIVHTLKKFQGSFTQKIIHRKIKKYFVLNDYFLTKVVRPKGIQVESFYPLRFPDFTFQLMKPEHEVWVTIIGGVEERRKDLVGSLQLIESVKDLPIKFIFLGKSNTKSEDFQRFHATIKKFNISSKIVYFDHFVSAEEFDAYVKKSDLIWPMVHPETPSAQEYFRNQISGAMNVSFAYHIPMFVHKEYFAAWEDLWSAFPYDFASFQSSLDKAIVERALKVQAMKESTKFSPHFQEKKYVDFIFNS